MPVRGYLTAYMARVSLGAHWDGRYGSRTALVSLRTRSQRRKPPLQEARKPHTVFGDAVFLT